jgi:dTDP-4-dehydrorhamnose reductase
LTNSKNLSGVFNCGSIDSCSKYEFSIKIANRFNFDKELISAISIDKFNFKAKRGKNLSLTVRKIEKALNYKLPVIDKSIDAFYSDSDHFIKKYESIK